MKPLFLALVMLSFTEVVYAQIPKRPPVILSAKVCESYLLSHKGVRMTRVVQKWFTQIPETRLQVEHVPMAMIDISFLRQPYEYFLEENQNRPFEELHAEYNNRIIQVLAKRTEDVQQMRELHAEEIKVEFTKQVAARMEEPLTPLEKVALGLNSHREITIGEVKEVRITGRDGWIVLVTVDQNGIPRGRAEIPTENVLLGYQNSVASWQAARYLEDPENFPQFGPGSQAIRKFLKDQGRVLIQRGSNGSRLGYLFEYDQTTSRAGRPRYINLRVVTLRECERPSAERHEVLFPLNGRSSNGMNLCVAPTDLALHTPIL